MNPRLYMRLLRKPEPKAAAPKPVYPRVPLFGLKVTDRRESWQARRDALEAEQSRALAQAQSRAIGAP